MAPVVLNVCVLRRFNRPKLVSYGLFFITQKRNKQQRGNTSLSIILIERQSLNRCIKNDYNVYINIKTFDVLRKKSKKKVFGTTVAIRKIDN